MQPRTGEQRGGRPAAEAESALDMDLGFRGSPATDAPRVGPDALHDHATDMIGAEEHDMVEHLLARRPHEALHLRLQEGTGSPSILMSSSSQLSRWER